MSGLAIRYDFLLMAVCRAQGIMMISSMKITGYEPLEPCSHHEPREPWPSSAGARGRGARDNYHGQNLNTVYL